MHIDHRLQQQPYVTREELTKITGEEKPRKMSGFWKSFTDTPDKIVKELNELTPQNITDKDLQDLGNRIRWLSKGSIKELGDLLYDVDKKSDGRGAMMVKALAYARYYAYNSNTKKAINEAIDTALREVPVTSKPVSGAAVAQPSIPPQPQNAYNVVALSKKLRECTTNLSKETVSSKQLVAANNLIQLVKDQLKQPTKDLDNENYAVCMQLIDLLDMLLAVLITEKQGKTLTAFPEIKQNLKKRLDKMADSPPRSAQASLIASNLVNTIENLKMLLPSEFQTKKI